MDVNKKLFSGTILSGIGSFISMAVNYLNIYLLTKVLGYSDYGYFILVSSIVTFLSSVSIVGLDGSFLYFFPKMKSEGELRKFIKYGLGIIVLDGALFAGLMIFSKNFLAVNIFHEQRLVYYINIMLYFILLDSIFNFCVGILRGALLIKQKVIYEQMLPPVMTACAILVVKAAFPAFYVVYAILGIKLILAIGGIYLVLNKMPRQFEHSQSSETLKVKKILKYGFIYTTTVLVTSVFSGASPWIIGGMMDAGNVGSFNIISRVSQLILLPMFVFDITFAPILSKLLTGNDIVESQRIFSFSTKIISILSIVLGAIIIVFFHEIVNLFGKEYLELMYIPLIVLIIGVLFHAFTGSSGWVLLMSGHNKLHLYNSVVSTILTLALNFLLVPLFGVLGAAISITCALIVNKISSTWQVRRYIGLRPFNDKVILLAVVSVGSIAAAAILSILFVNHLFLRICILCLTVVSLMMGGYMTMDIDEKKLVESLLVRLNYSVK